MARKPVIDPVVILEEMASDPETPATARVMAAKALLALQREAAKKTATEPADAVTKRALRLLKGGKA